MTKVFIDGSEGTTGLRIYERFEGRDDIEIMKIAPELRKDIEERRRMINSSDITFLCLPDAAAIEAVSLVENQEVRIIDTSTAHRTESGWSYGFAELSSKHRENIKNGRLIAVPGCHASGFIALAYPLVSTGLIDKAAMLSCMSLTGYSGGGKKTIALYNEEHRSVEYDAPRQYGLTQQHKHLKEMKAICGLTYAPVFMPVINDIYCGMEVSIPLHSAGFLRKASVEEVSSIYAEHYKNQKLMRVLPANAEQPINGFVAANALAGLDYMEIMVHGNDERMVVTARFDNLGKGASGAAIQCMNIMLGIPDDYGLNT